MRDSLAARHLRFRALLIDMDPLLVAGRIRKLVDAILRNLDPVADADLCADGGSEIFETVEYAHKFCPVKSFFSGPWPGRGSSASVPTSPPATVPRGGFPSRGPLPREKAITAMSVTTRSTWR